MADLTYVESLLKAALFEPECDHGIHRQGCKHCEAPEERARLEARRKLERLGYTRSPMGLEAVQALIASSNALEAHYEAFLHVVAAKSGDSCLVCKYDYRDCTTWAKLAGKANELTPKALALIPGEGQ